MDPVLILFAIEAGLRLGRKLAEVLVDETHERSLVLPLGDLYADLREVNAVAFFDRPENRPLVEAGGPYYGFAREELAKAHATLTVLDERLGGRGDTLSEARATVEGLHRYEQLRKGLGAGSPAQRIVGTIVELGIDYFRAHPGALAPGGAARTLLLRFVSEVEGLEFAEGEPEALVGELMIAVLEAASETPLLPRDPRAQALLAGVTRSLLLEGQRGGTEAERLRSGLRVRRLARSLLRGGAAALSAEGGLFAPDPRVAPELIQSVLAQLLDALRDEEDLLTWGAAEQLFDVALRAASDHPELFAIHGQLQVVLAATASVLSEPRARELVSRELAAALLALAVEVTAEHVGTLVDPEDFESPVVAVALDALLRGLSGELVGRAALRSFLSRRQLAELAGLVFDAVAQHREILLEEGASVEHTPLAQVVASVALALGETPDRLVNGEGALEIIESALQHSTRNLYGLIDSDHTDPASNLLFHILAQLVDAASSADDPRRLLGRQVFVEVVEQVLAAASMYSDALFEARSPVVEESLEQLLGLAAETETRINGSNLPGLTARLLVARLRHELDVRDDEAVAEWLEGLLCEV